MNTIPNDILEFILEWVPAVVKHMDWDIHGLRRVARRWDACLRATHSLARRPASDLPVDPATWSTVHALLHDTGRWARRLPTPAVLCARLTHLTLTSHASPIPTDVLAFPASLRCLDWQDAGLWSEALRRSPGPPRGVAGLCALRLWGFRDGLLSEEVLLTTWGMWLLGSLQDLTLEVVATTEYAVRTAAHLARLDTGLLTRLILDTDAVPVPELQRLLRAATRLQSLRLPPNCAHAPLLENRQWPTITCFGRGFGFRGPTLKGVPSLDTLRLDPARQRKGLVVMRDVFEPREVYDLPWTITDPTIRDACVAAAAGRSLALVGRVDAHDGAEPLGGPDAPVETLVVDVESLVQWPPCLRSANWPHGLRTLCLNVEDESLAADALVYTLDGTHPLETLSLWLWPPTDVADWLELPDCARASRLRSLTLHLREGPLRRLFAHAGRAPALRALRVYRDVATPGLDGEAAEERPGVDAFPCLELLELGGAGAAAGIPPGGAKWCGRGTLRDLCVHGWDGGEAEAATAPWGGLEPALELVCALALRRVVDRLCVDVALDTLDDGQALPRPLRTRLVRHVSRLDLRGRAGPLRVRGLALGDAQALGAALLTGGRFATNVEVTLTGGLAPLGRLLLRPPGELRTCHVRWSPSWDQPDLQDPARMARAAKLLKRLALTAGRCCIHCDTGPYSALHTLRGAVGGGWQWRIL